MTEKTLSALIVDHDNERRQQLRYMLKMTDQYDVVDLVRDHAEAELRFQDEAVNYQVVFFITETAREELRGFVTAMQELPQGELSVFVALLKGSVDGYSAEDAVLFGAHGSLCEPFSVEDIQEQTVDAREALGRLQVERQQKIITELVGAADQKIGAISTLMKVEMGARGHLLELRDYGKSLQGIEPELQEHYFEQLFEVFENASLADGLPESLTTREKLSVERKLKSKQAVPSFEFEEVGGRRLLVCQGDLSKKGATQQLDSLLQGEKRADHSQLTVHLGQAYGFDNRLASVLLHAFKLYKQEGGSFKVVGDRGFVKESLRKVKEFKLKQSSS